MKKLSKYGTMVFITYSVIVVIFIILGGKNIGIFNEDISFGIFLSWAAFVVTCIYSAIFCNL